VPKQLADLAEDMATSMAKIIKLEDDRKKLSVELKRLSANLGGGNAQAMRAYSATHSRWVALGHALKAAEDYAEAKTAYDRLAKSLL
jgi:hypothetical protein